MVDSFARLRKLLVLGALLAFVGVAPAGAAVLHAAAHRSGLAASHPRGQDRHEVISSGVSAAVTTDAPVVVATGEACRIAVPVPESFLPPAVPETPFSFPPSRRADSRAPPR